LIVNYALRIADCLWNAKAANERCWRLKRVHYGSGTAMSSICFAKQRKSRKWTRAWRYPSIHDESVTVFVCGWWLLNRSSTVSSVKKTT